MQSKPQNPSDRHHYVPEFLQRAWASPDKLLWRYFRNTVGVIECRKTAPSGVGYKKSLYKSEGLPPEHEQQVEEQFMAPLDGAAAAVHELLLEGRVARLTDEQRSRWAGFVMSLWYRTPREVAGIRDAVEAMLEANVAKAVLGENEAVGSELINMHWGVIEIDPKREFFISDCPIAEPRHFPRLGSPASYLAMPIAPARLFVASKSPTLIRTLKALPQRDLVRRQNRATVEQAEHFVGATDRRADQFIRANFGVVGAPPRTRGIAPKYRALGQAEGGGE